MNPHDVLGYPSSFVQGGYDPSEFADLQVPLPPTLDEDLREKPTVQALMKLGQTSYLGALRGRGQQQRYVDFYAHLHRVVDEKIGRLLRALGDPADPQSLRSRTVIVRTSDHGEMALSHGGLRQKMFNAYEESLRVPFVISSPQLFREPWESDALVSLVDVVPTLLGLAGAPGDPSQFDGRDLTQVLGGENGGVRDAVLFTYDDHQAGTAFQDAPGQPNRIRCVRDRRWKYAIYLDPSGKVAPEYELYDLDADPHEALNLVDKRSGVGRTERARRELTRLHAPARAGMRRHAHAHARAAGSRRLTRCAQQCWGLDPCPRAAAHGGHPDVGVVPLVGQAAARVAPERAQAQRLLAHGLSGAAVVAARADRDHTRLRRALAHGPDGGQRLGCAAARPRLPPALQAPLPDPPHAARRHVRAGEAARRRTTT